MNMLIPREIISDITNWLDKRKILLIKGSRQVGKTTLLKVIQGQLQNKGKETYYLSIDQEFGNAVVQTSKNLFVFLRDQFPGISPERKLYLFLDEFQYLPNAGIFLKSLFDQAEDIFQIIVSGSSSLEITKNSEFLTGRKIEFTLYPLNYKEFLSYKSNIRLNQKISICDFNKIREFWDAYRTLLQGFFEEYVSFGGYPEIATTSPIPDKLSILKELVSTYIAKDIIAFLRIENVRGFSDLLKILCDQIGSLVNKSELSNTANLNIDTVNKYLDILEGTYVLDFNKPYFTNVRKELSKMSKVYVNDFGLRNVVLNKISTLAFISGQERENFVYNCLKYQYGKENLKFYRTISKAEIDFILERSDRLIPIEVKSTKKVIPLPKSMIFFLQEHVKSKDKLALIITDDVLEKLGSTFYIPLSLLPFLDIE